MATATYEPIATYTVPNATTLTFTFSSIPATYTDLKLVFVGTVLTASTTMAVRYNGDTATNYSTTTLQGSGAAASSVRAGTSTSIEITDNNIVGGSATIPSFASLDIFSYAGSTYKTGLGTVSNDQNGTGSVLRIVSLWRSTAAITSLTIFNISGGVNYIGINSTATLYGIKAA